MMDLMFWKKRRPKEGKEARAADQAGPRGKTRETVETLVAALALALVIRAFLVQSFMIPTPSMVPTLLVGDHILVAKYVYGFKIPFVRKKVLPLWTPKRGDVIVFGFPPDPRIDYVKRVTAVAGDVVEVREGELYLNGVKADDPHSHHLGPNRPGPDSPANRFGPFTVPPHTVFCMGDNRDNSFDSRFWVKGGLAVDLDLVRGKAATIYWAADLDRPLPLIGALIPPTWSWKDPARTPPLVPAMLLFTPKFNRIGTAVR
jgi:signal peptidase I